MHKIKKLHLPKGISVVIPNYNGRQLLPQILPPLYEALQNAGLDYEVIISDDASTDASISYIQADHPAIKLIENPVNRGFAPTANAGIFASTYSYTLLLNSDVKLTANYFKFLIPYFDKDDCFGVMGRIVGWDDDKIQDGGKYPYFHGVKIKTSGNYIPLQDDEGPYYSMYLSGANALMNTAILQLLGGFNELFAPYYVEDYELSLRAWRKGYLCYYEHRAVCRHKTSVTIKSSSKKEKVKIIYNRNKMFLHAIHLPASKLIVWKLQLGLEAFIHICFGKLFYIKALLAFMGKRKQVAESRTLLKNNSAKRLLTLQEVAQKVNAQISSHAIQKW